MEPTFIATPYAQASSPSSRQIRAWLDEQEAGYTQWRANRKPVAHTFASAKLNSPLRALPRVVTTAPHTPLWMTLSNQAAEAEAAAAASLFMTKTTMNGARTTRSGSVVPDRVAIETLTLGSVGSRRSSSVSTPTLPTISTREAAAQATVKKSVRPSDFPSVARTRTSALAKQRLQEHLYTFHSRQVFSFARSPDEENQAEQESWSETSDVALEHSLDDLVLDTPPPPPSDSASDSSTTICSSGATPTAPTVLLNRQQDSCMLEGLAFVVEEDYVRIFEHDWRLSDVERVIRDAVERKRIYQILKRSYRLLLWFFRFYAGKSGLAAGGGAGNNAHALFQIADKLKLLEDLNVQCVDPGKFGIANTPLTRDALVGFMLSVARMLSSHSQNPARLRVLVAEGIEVSDAMKTLVRDYFGVFAQIQDANHFRTVFLRKPPPLTRAHRRLQDVLNQHMESLHIFFGESVKAAPATIVITVSDPSASATAPHDEPRMTVSFPQFLSALRALGLITNPKAPSSTSATPQVGAASSAPTPIEEGRALRAFLSCLGMSEGECTDRSAAVSTRDATFEQFVEALLRVALLRRELVVCRGRYDVCPGELASDLCRCDPEQAQYDFAAFDDAVEELFAAVHAFCLGRARRRASLKVQMLRSLHPANTVHKLSSNTSSAQRTTTRLSLLPAIESDGG